MSGTNRNRNRNRIVLASAIILLLSSRAYPQKDPEALHVSVTVAHGPQRPAVVPILPGLQVEKPLFGGQPVGRLAPGNGYQPAGKDSFLVHNGPGRHDFILTSGMWWLRVGDRPRMSLELRSGHGAYAEPALLPGLALSGELRLVVEAGNKQKYLDEFSSIDAVLSPGSVLWKCSDDALGLKVELQAVPLITPWGLTATAKIAAMKTDSEVHPTNVTLRWQLSHANHVADEADVAHFTTGKYTQIYLGTVERNGNARNGNIEAHLNLPASGEPVTSRLLCVWGYSGYDKQGVADAYKRLEFRPFDQAWLDGMKPKWFDHWIGGGLEPRRKFLDAREHADAALKQASDFWEAQRARVQIKTPDPRFDNVVNHVAAQSRVIFEYPGFIHGLGYAKYGKINHGYYGFEAAGMHSETADSLQFIGGTQDVTGRQRYFMTTFALSNWHEDMDFYFPEQCWYHWRWTGDKEFLRAIWPAARRALEHGLAVSDPRGDGLMTGYYEMWNSDQNNPGGFSALQTALGWAALRAGRDMAAALGDVDFSPTSLPGVSYDPNYARRYQRLMTQTEKQYLARLWQNDVGGWSSAEDNGVNRPRPHTCEQNYAIWRGLGTPMRNYMAMRYIRENLHRADPATGSEFEYINDWWPIQWSHHYPASGDTCATFQSACAAGDVDAHWPAFDTVAESAYANGGMLWHATGSNSMEMEPLFLQAVIDGLFGVKPWFGENLLVFRPAFPSQWNDAELRHCDVSYQFHRDAAGVRMNVATPVPRKMRVEIPVRGPVEQVTLDGMAAEYKLESAVNCARVVIQAPAGRVQRFAVMYGSLLPNVEGSPQVILDEQATFSVSHAKVVAVHDPQQAVRSISIASRGDGAEVTFVPTRAGKPTLFLELEAGNVKWLHPLDLAISPPWTIRERYRPEFSRGGPAVISPLVDEKKNELALELVNHRSTPISGTARITVAGATWKRDVSIAPSSPSRIVVPVASVFDRLSPGSVPVQVELAARTETARAVNWAIGKSPAAWSARMRPIDLAASYNADAERLFSPRTKWRIDYTGAQHGVDRRQPLPLRDDRGWVTMNGVTSLFEYGVLPEQCAATKFIKFGKLPETSNDTAGVPFRTTSGRLLALCCTEPYEQFPSRAVLRLPEPRRVEKLYLLSANLVKTLKCYYPGAEIRAQYADGTEQLFSLAAPYTLPSVVGHICPAAYAIRVGSLQGEGNPVPDTACYYSVTDLLLDRTKLLASIELRCVATETLLGVAGLTMLESQ